MRIDPKSSVALALVMLAASGCVEPADAADESGAPSDPDDPPAATDPVEVLPAVPPGEFRLARTTEERIAWVPVKDAANWHVVYSLKLTELGDGERVAARGEVQLTTCQASDLPDTPCKKITPFDPSFKAKIILADGASDAEGVNLVPARDVTCSHFEHHCAVALGEEVVGKLTGVKFVNLVVSATGPNPGGDDRMIVDEGHGGLYVTRIGQGADPVGTALPLADVSPDWMALDNESAGPREPHVVFQVKLDGAEPGEILDLDARIDAITDGNGGKPANCSGARDPLITHQVFLSDQAKAPWLDGHKLGTMTAKNGSNCHLDDTCTYRKSGAASLGKDPPGVVWVSVVASGGRSCSAPGDRWKVGNQSAVTVRRRL